MFHLVQFLGSAEDGRCGRWCDHVLKIQYCTMTVFEHVSFFSLAATCDQLVAYNVLFGSKE